MSPRDQGFAMADALVALIIAALLMSGLIGINQSANQATFAAERKLLAAQLARSVLLSDDPALEGQTVLEGTAFEWSLAERKDYPESPLVRKAVTISWLGRSGHQSMIFETAMLEPAHAR